MAELLNELLPAFERLTQRPEDYLNVQDKVAADVTDLLKNLYDYTKSAEDGRFSGKALPELIVEDFDQEQIWQELELQNNGRSDSFVSDVASLVSRKKRLVLKHDLETLEDVKSVDGQFSDDCKSAESFEAEISSNDEQSEGERHEFSDEVKPKSQRKQGLSRVSEVDDKFFKLSELEEFLELEDKREARQQDSSEESIDLFRSSDDEEDESDNDLHYADFFDDPNTEEKSKKKKIEKGMAEEEDGEEKEEGDDDNEEDEEENRVEDIDDDDDEEEEEKVNNRTKKVHFMTSDEDSEDEKKATKSNLEARQERIQARIKQLEDQVLGEKPWQMKGEISASRRPQNSLLEEVVEFDLTTRPAPVMTEKTTQHLEDIIQQRVKDRAWDDVERKVKPVETPNEYKKKLVLDQEKSKLSLAEIYEKEFVKQREALNTDGSENQEEEEPAEHKEIRKMMASLFAKLDALSNFHYTPRAPAPEVKIVSNLPAITMEEVTPVAVSDAALLAPEEVKEKSKGDLVGKAERTSTDRNRERRQKKARQRERRLEREKRERAVEKLRPGLGNKYSKERALRDMETVTKNSNVTRMEEKDNDKSVKSSTAFFNRLQDEVKTLIKKKTAASNTTSQMIVPSAKRLKL